MLDKIGSLFLKWERFSNKCKCLCQLSKFSQVGKGCVIRGPGTFTGSHISLGDNVTIGTDSVFLSSDAYIKIGSNVLFGPHVFIITGNHRINVVGQYITEVTEKLPENDADVVIGDDVWIGAGSIILKGVQIGEGCVIGAGSVVTKSLEPYGVYAGNPAKNIKDRFTPEELSEHLRTVNERRGRK